MADKDNDCELIEQEWTQFAKGWTDRFEEHGLLSIELGGEGNVSKTHVKVLERQKIPEVPFPLFHDVRIYLVKNGGIVKCVDVESGNVLFLNRISSRGSYYASPIAVGENIYLASGQGVVTVLRAGVAMSTLDCLASKQYGVGCDVRSGVYSVARVTQKFFNCVAENQSLNRCQICED